VFSNADNQEEGFENARTRLKGTFNRMMVMAERSGVGWRMWLLVFALIFLVFFYVWIR
jgi:blocked-early-in-transport protein 1